MTPTAMPPLSCLDGPDDVPRAEIEEARKRGTERRRRMMDGRQTEGGPGVLGLNADQVRDSAEGATAPESPPGSPADDRQQGSGREVSARPEPKPTVGAAASPAGITTLGESAPGQPISRTETSAPERAGSPRKRGGLPQTSRDMLASAMRHTYRGLRKRHVTRLYARERAHEIRHVAHMAYIDGLLWTPHDSKSGDSARNREGEHGQD